MKRSLLLFVVAALLIVGAIVGVSMMGGDGGSAKGRSGGPDTWDARTIELVAHKHQEIEDQLNRASFPGARLLATELIDQFPGDPQAYVYMAKAAMGQRQWQTAYDAAIEALQRDPELHDIHFLAGVLAEKTDRPETALKHYADAMDAYDSAAKYPLYRANLLLKRNELDDAQLYALRVIRLDPTVPQAYAILAEVAGRQGKLPMALDQINRAIKLCPADSADRFAYTIQRVKLLRRTGPTERAEALNALLALPVEYRQQQRAVTEELAQTYLSLERPGDAAGAWSAWFKNHPGDAAAAAEAGLALVRAGEIELAREYLQLAQRIKPHDPTVQALGEALSGE
jgi:tetratricopeptide (TPR) repeat protein